MDTPVKTAAFTCAGHTVRGRTIPDHLVRGLDAHVNHGQRTGSFLQAALCNDLRGVINHADDEALAALPAIVGWLYWEAPALCWGSAEKVEAWRIKGGHLGANFR